MLKDLKQEGNGFIDTDGCSWQTRADYMFTGVLVSCGCGDPPSIGRYVYDMLKKYVYLGNEDYSCWDRTSYEDLPVMFFLSWADRCGYTEHGTSIRGSWITDLGKELLADLETVLDEVDAAEKEEREREERDERARAALATTDYSDPDDAGSKFAASLIAGMLGIPSGYLVKDTKNTLADDGFIGPEA